MAQKLDLTHFRKLLEDERARIEHEIEDLRSVDSGASQEDEQGELTSYDEHIGDTGTETFERERDVALGENAEAILRQVEIALQKIDDGTYGICERCGKPIGKARLEALPYAALCIEDASRFEGQT
jgi:DnaK suppressor protein